VRDIKLSVDYGLNWPLSDSMWMPEEQPDWPALISEDLIEALKAWSAFFNKNANYETGLFGSEEKRKWFDLEGFRLQRELSRQVGHLYNVTLHLWF
jgi:hypothetical protein